MSQITLFTDILPEEQERMRVCFQAKEMIFQNGETIMEYSHSMNKIGLILSGRAVLYCCDEAGNQYLIDELKKMQFLENRSFFRLILSTIMSMRKKKQKSCLLIISMLLSDVRMPVIITVRW